MPLVRIGKPFDRASGHMPALSPQQLPGCGLSLGNSGRGVVGAAADAGFLVVPRNVHAHPMPTHVYDQARRVVADRAQCV